MEAPPKSNGERDILFGARMVGLRGLEPGTSSLFEIDGSS
jgi:hypothetical protein